MNHDPIADLARLREIAEEGRRQPLLGGRHLILWGCAIALAALLHWGVAYRYLPWPQIAIAVIWASLVTGTAIAARSPLLLRPQLRQSIDLGNRVERLIWQYGGTLLALIAASMFAAAMVKLNQSGDDSGFRLFQLMPPLTFGVYAIALRITAEVANVPALKPYALLSLIFAAGTALLAGSMSQLLVAAAGYLVVSVLPGRTLIGLEGQ